MDIKEIESTLKPLKAKLHHHKLYRGLSSVADIKIFMENHVYAVWDFMSLLKALQLHLTCTSVPWKPAQNTNTARFINEIVLEEESDKNENGAYRSHYEMYLEAMKEVGADTKKASQFLESFDGLDTILDSIKNSDLNQTVKNFLHFTFETIQTGEPHKIAAAFTFGREELIPDMFLQIIEQAGADAYPKLSYYLKRHIELDGNEHGPLSLKMIQELCGNDEQKWTEVALCSQDALRQRIALWDHIAHEIMNPHEVVA